MIRGDINERLEPLVTVEISNGDGQYHPFKALLDTGFSGHLTLPPDEVERLGLERVDRISITLANGQDIWVSVHEGYVKWFEQTRRVKVLATDGQSLLGMSLLENCKITILVQAGNEALIEEIRQT